MLKVLIADDSAFMRTIIRNYIKVYPSVAITEAENGEEALQKFEEVSPNLIFLDIIMPKMSGLEVLKEIRRNTKSSKIYMVTSVGQSKVIEEALKIGAEGYITKPFKAEEIKNIVEKLLKKW